MAGPEHVAVIGGGAVGTTLAGDLADRGVAVTLFERGAIASGSSGRAAGLCYDAYADRRDVAIAARAIERFREFDVGFRDCPYVLLAREGDTDQAGAIADLAEQMQAREVDIDLLDGTELAAEFPVLVTEDVRVAAVARNAGVLDATTYTETMADRARAAGVTVEGHTTATLADPTTVVAGGTERDFDAVVVAAGPATKSLVASVDISIPLKVYRAQALVTGALLTVPSASDATDLPTVFDATGHYYLRPWGEGVLIGDGVTADVDLENWDPSADEWFVEESRERLRTALGVDATVERSWAGLCTATPDRDPLVGPVADGLYVATGWHGHGLMRAPAIAERLAEQLLGGDGISGFDPNRFDGDEEFSVVEGMALETS